MTPEVKLAALERAPAIRLGGKKADQAYGALKRTIVLRHYAPGLQLREQELAAEFQCSQSTVREALINLSKDGLVKRTGYHGTHVTDTSMEEARVMVQIRLDIERSVAAQLHARTDLDRSSINALLSAMDASHASGDLYLSSELDREFHEHLACLANLDQLAPMLKRCSLHIHRFTLGSVEVPRDFFQEAGVGNEHRLLLDALCEGSVADAQHAFAQHLALVLQRWAPSLYTSMGVGRF